MDEGEQLRCAGRVLAVLVDDHAVDARHAALLGEDEVARDELEHQDKLRRNHGRSAAGFGADGAPAGGRECAAAVEPPPSRRRHTAMRSRPKHSQPYSVHSIQSNISEFRTRRKLDVDVPQQFTPRHATLQCIVERHAFATVRPRVS